MQNNIDSKGYMQALYPWLVWFLGACFFFYKYLVQVSPSVMTSDLMHAFNIGGAGLGNLSACYFYAYLIMQIPVGILLDKYSPRYLTALAILVCGLSTLVFSQTNSLGLACLSRAFIGFGAAFAAVSSFKIAALWFAPKRFALISGMCMTAAMLGAVGGQAPLSLLVQDFGWRVALQIIAGLGILLSLIYVLTIRDKTKKCIVKQTERKARPLLILKSKQAWLLSLYSGLAFAPVSVFGGLWGVPFLQQAYQLSASMAAVAVSWIFIGFAMGAPLLGWLSDVIGKRKPLMLFGTLLAFLGLIIVIYGSNLNMGLISVCLFLFGFGASGFFISFSMIKEGFPILLTATVLGFMNTFDSICEALTEPLIGVLLDIGWDGHVVNGIHQFSIYGYKLALLLLPIYLIIALILLVFIKETYCQNFERD
ncbi:MAG: MFS transporter [Legionella longbeachae]|nr:MFS transporter [Legionella longbeachae]